LTPDHLKASSLPFDTPIVGTDEGQEFSRAILNDEPSLNVELALAIDRGDGMLRLALILLPSMSADGYNARRLLLVLRRSLLIAEYGRVIGLG
jgi:hypothetical protein